ncbi:hypothetical protein OCK72_07075 [Fusobacterium simiae]|uniref:HEAT repeat domain-containing protein n=1 Tax=Fusobacterium simiae TaxID=855 RepID=A0ABT4DII4_FUSSI|nr:hypothetical protein [Fusobacterium simiae]MCY7008417.1 hypothetical protein [Fusobacterium simiae]
MENKNLSIYELIKTSIQPNGELPEDFKLPSKDPNGVPWADGAMDGVFIYHTVRNEEDIESLKNIVFQISEEKFEEAQNNLENLDFSMISRSISLLNWIIQEKEKINANNLYQFASSQLATSKNIEVVKFCLSVLSIMDVERDIDTIEKVKTLALSDEFTLYCLDIIVKLENSNEEIFKIAKKVKDWGRIHSIAYLEVTNNKIKEWVLEEGCHNGVLPAYTALACAKKINLIEILNDEKISNKKFSDISYLINALLDEGPMMGISALENKEILIERYLEKAKYLSSTEDDYRAIMMIKEYIKDNKEIGNKFINICDEILNSEKTRNKITELIKDGNGYDIAKYLGIDTDKYALKYLETNNFLENPYIIYYILKRENMEKLVLFIEKNLPLEKLKGLPTDKFNQRTKKDKEVTFLDTMIRNLRNYTGIGENLIIYALNSPYVDMRYGAVNTLEGWKEKGYILSNDIIKNLKNLEKIEIDDRLKEKLNKLIK